jgi:hypothetical protein
MRSRFALPEERAMNPEHPGEAATGHLPSASELDFLRALRAHIEKNGGKFPNWNGVLEVLRDLGYEKSE